MYRASSGKEELLLDINPGAASSNPTNFVKALDGRVYFAAKTEEAGNELWVTDGTTEGTRMVKDLNLVPGEGSDPSVMAPFKDGIIYAAKDAIAAAEGNPHLFYCDGNDISVVKRGIKIQNSGESRNRYMATSPNGLKAFFVADDGIHGKELWFSDGTPEGTHMVLDIGFFPTDNDPSKTIDTRYEHQLMVNNEQCIFRAYTPAWWVGLEDQYKWINNECWVSDGTALGTYCLGDYFKSPDPGDPTRTGHSIANYFQVCNGMVLMRIANENGCDLGGTNLIPELFDESGKSIPGTGIQMLAKGNGPDNSGNPFNSWFQCAATWDSLYVASLDYQFVSPDIDNKDLTGKQVPAGREIIIYDPRKDTLFLVADKFGPLDGLSVNFDGNTWPANANRRLYFPGRAEAGSADDNMYYIEALADDPTHTPKVLFSGEGSITNYYQINYNEKLAVVTRSAADEAGQPDIVHLYVYDDGLDKSNAITANGDARDIPVYTGPGSTNRGMPTTGIEKYNMSDDIKVFPNPAKQSVTISMTQDRAEMKIFGISGQMVWAGEIFNNRSLDVSNLKAGLYVMKIRTDKGISSVKLEISQ
jgi:ELWxxDGT repeat protein